MAQGRRRIIDDKECDKCVLDCEEEVLAICREREVVAEGISRCYRVRERFEDVGG